MTSPNGCKICLHDKADEIDKLIVGKVSYRTIIKSFPELNISNISRHKDHIGIEVEVGKPEISPEELDKQPAPDVVKLVERQVTKFELLERRRKLTPSEERERARFMEFLLKITIFKLEKSAKDEITTSWVDVEIAKLKAGEYDVRK